MTPFSLVEPRSLQEAAALLRSRGEAAPLAGGTAIMLMMKAGLFRPDCLVSLRGIEQEFTQIARNADGALHIGAMVSLRRLELSEDVANAAPIIVSTMRRLANVRVRNAATIGGALAHGDPHLDLPPVLIALGASVVIVGQAGERTMPVEELFRSYLETSLESGELIGKVIVPPQGSRRAIYLKHTTRSADDWPALGIALSAEVAGGKAGGVRAAIGAATDTPRRMPAVEALLNGNPMEGEVIAQAGDAAANEAEVRSDARGSAAYKRELIRVFTRRAIRALVAGGQG